MRFGQNMKKVRTEKGFTLKQLSFRTGIDASQLSRYESAGVSPSVETAARVAEALGVELGALVRTKER